MTHFISVYNQYDHILNLTEAAEIPAVCAAIGVDFFTFLKPSDPHEVRTMYWPRQSVTWMCVLEQEIKDKIQLAICKHAVLGINNNYNAYTTKICSP